MLAHTPNLDRLAARGMRFDLAYCNQAVCAPSRNHLMLGARSTTLGVYSLGKPFREAVPDAVTLTQYFMQHGWRAEGVGKILHTGHGNRDDPASWSVPFQAEKVVEYLDPESPTHGQLTREEAYFTNQKLGANRSLPRGQAWEKLDVPDQAYADGRIAEEGIRRLRAAVDRPQSPLFLALGFVKPHLPFTVPRRFWDLHDPARIVLPANRRPPAGAPVYAGKTLGELNQYAPVPQMPPLSDELRRTLIHGYYASASYVDSQIGKVLDELDRLGLAEKTVIVLWGDHGWHLGDHGMWTKHTNYEQANRIPLLIVAPGVTAPGSHTRHLVETVDLFPTLAQLAGLPRPEVPQTLDGISLVPVMRDPALRLRDHATHVFPRQHQGRLVLGRAIRTERHRLVEWKAPGAPPETATLELYDYEKDPEETRNLAGEQPEVVARLRQILARHPEAKAPVAD
jgi:iduronate 2-sulfatase